MACTEVEMCVSEATRGIDHPHFPFLKVVFNEEGYMLQKKSRKYECSMCYFFEW
jgi:hypothetical protein